jgi:hypothetical protein
MVTCESYGNDYAKNVLFLKETGRKRSPLQLAGHNVISQTAIQAAQPRFKGYGQAFFEAVVC